MSARSFSSLAAAGLVPGLAEACWALPLPFAITRAADGVFRAVNRAFETFSGYAAAEVIGRSSLEIGLYADGVRPDLRQWIRPAGSSRCERRIRTKRGGLRTVRLAVGPVKVAGEDCLLVSVTDITPRAGAGGPAAAERSDFSPAWSRPGGAGDRAEAAPLEAEGLRRGLPHLRADVFRLDRELRLVGNLSPWARRALARLFNPTSRAREARRVRQQLLHALDRERPVRVLTRLPGGGSCILEVEALHDRAGCAVGLVGTAREAADPPSAPGLQAGADAVPAGILRVDARGCLVYANSAAAELVGLSRSALAGRSLDSLVAAPDREAAQAAFKRARVGRKTVSGEVRLSRADGQRRWVFAQARSAGHAEGAEEVIVALFDITPSCEYAAIATRRALAGARTASSSFLGNVVLGLSRALDVEFAFVLLRGVGSEPGRLAALCSDGALAEGIAMPLAEAPAGELLSEKPRVIPAGLARLAPRTVADWAPGASSAAVVPLVSRERGVMGYLGVMARRKLRDAPAVLAVLETAEPTISAELERAQAVEHRRAMEQRLAHRQRLETLGLLAAGVIHDFNNLLNAVFNYTLLARGESTAEDPRGRYLDKVVLAAQRGQDLVRRLLLLARGASPESDARRPLELASIVSEALTLLRPVIPPAIAIARQVDPATPPVLGDAIQLHQVMMNLCLNAVQAVGTGPGRIALAISPFVVEAGRPSPDPDLRPGRYARVSVTDDGPGIDPAILPRIFDPGFTTKPAGEGTGLGLTVVADIARAHGGVVAVRSAPGAGATFEIYLPAAPHAGKAG